ncbi:response regulator [Lentibacillus sp. Marseille-P4043]|uniref:response regulator n=1 Tax=Lentibacillus sp. Marseille-P4043 TaxID=2040293 RepID=UPI00131A508B|nr:response regulator [Lentibacillus sp. Marseille-P4043]
MRVLIAEDELLERKAMKKFIEDNFNDIKVVGEAPNGRKAIELAKTLQPDIIFMDIKMPGINGLEAIETIIQINPVIKFILVSAYDSFEYAKQAMTFGIKEYILKPGKKEEIIKAIRRVQKEIVMERQQVEEKTQSNQVLKEHLITKLMQYPIETDAINIHRKFFSTMTCGYFLVVQAKGNFLQNELNHILEKLIETPFIAHHHENLYAICIFLRRRPDKAEILRTARGIHLKLGQGSFVGAGHSYSSIDQFPKSYQEAFIACYQLEKENARHYGFFNRETYTDNRESLTRLIEKVEQGNDQDAVRLYKEYQDFLLQHNLDELYLHMKRIMLERGIAFPERPRSEIMTTKDWERFITVCCMHIQDYYQSKQYIEKAKKYIQQHFQGSITLEETAAHVNLSPNYFSNMFKHEFGTTFIEYVTKVRLHKAKELLEENNYSLKEISYMVGYKDPNYFSRVFKKHFSESPKRFQQGILKK